MLSRLGYSRRIRKLNGKCELNALNEGQLENAKPTHFKQAGQSCWGMGKPARNANSVVCDQRKPTVEQAQQQVGLSYSRRP